MTVWYAIIAIVGILALGAAVVLFIFVSQLK